jgi:hypothetical protein
MILTTAATFLGAHTALKPRDQHQILRYNILNLVWQFKRVEYELLRYPHSEHKTCLYMVPDIWAFPENIQDLYGSTTISGRVFWILSLHKRKMQTLTNLNTYIFWKFFLSYNKHLIWLESIKTFPLTNTCSLLSQSCSDCSFRQVAFLVVLRKSLALKCNFADARISEKSKYSHEDNSSYVTFEVLTAVSKEMAVVWDTVLCNPVESDWCFRYACSLHHEGDSVMTLVW